MNNILFIASAAMVFGILLALNFDAEYHAKYAAMINNATLNKEPSDIHYEPINKTGPYWATLNTIQQVDRDKIKIRFEDNRYFIGNYHVPDFEYTAVIEENQMFVATCIMLGEYPGLGVLRYLGTETVDGQTYYRFHHITGTVYNAEFDCVYPDIIKYGLDVDYEFKIPDITAESVSYNVGQRGWINVPAENRLAIDVTNASGSHALDIP